MGDFKGAHRAIESRILCSLLALAGIIAASNVHAQERRTLYLSGEIGKEPVKMVLSIRGDSVLGYFSTNENIPRILSGRAYGTKLILHDSLGYRSVKSGFMLEMQGKQVNGSRVEWSRKIPFKAFINTDENGGSPRKAGPVEGNYEKVIESERQWGSAAIQWINGTRYFFVVSVGTESGCEGYLSGLLDFKSGSKGTFSTEGCERLTISGSSDILTMTESACELHGVMCRFAGTYKRTLTKR